MDGANETISAVPEGKFSGFVMDPEKCRLLSLVEKRELVHEIARWPAEAPKILSSFSRRELLDIICAESGKERKNSGWTKGRMIDSLLNIISGGTSKIPKSTRDAKSTSPPKSQHAPKRLKKSDASVQYLATFNNPLCGGGMGMKKEQKFVVCGNLACRATLCPDDGFCKRCSCCICHRYDDNKDPSLWLTCNSDPPDVGSSCGMSCHLKCALKHERAGILKSGCSKKLDGKFSCVACLKVNDLMSTWRKQLVAVKEARRVDVLCLRILLAHKILDGSELFKALHKPVDLAMKKLKKELGPLNRVCARMDRGIVNRLSCGAEVQKLCATALENFSNLFNNNNNLSSHSVDPEKSLNCKINPEELYSVTVTIIIEYEESSFKDLLGFRIWYKESVEKSYPKSPYCVVSKDVKKYKVYDLKPSTEYTCAVSFFSITEMLGTWEAKWLTPPASHESTSSETDQCQSNGMDLNAVTDQILHLQIVPMRSSSLSDDLTAQSGEKQQLYLLDHINNHTAPLMPHHPAEEALPFVNHLSIPSTPSKVDGKSVGGGGYLGGSGCPPPVSHQGRSEGCDFEFCVKVVKSLERDGHLSLDFRVKLLTWYSLKATKQERRVVSAFVDAMVDDPPSLAGQLIHTFTDVIGGEKLNNNPMSKSCTKLWH